MGCPVLIGDGLKGTDDIAVPVAGGEYVKEARIGRAIMDADVFISLTHFKGHEMTGFGGAIKNIGMGCGSRAGKTEQHSSGQAQIDEQLCTGCRTCEKQCANEALAFDDASKKMTVNEENCVGCGRCLGVCNFDVTWITLFKKVWPNFNGWPQELGEPFLKEMQGDENLPYVRIGRQRRHVAVRAHEICYGHGQSSMMDPSAF